MNRLKFASRTNRDAAFAEHRRAGRAVARSSIRNVHLHPMYVQDVPSGDTGFGNTDYQRFWQVLYVLEVR